MSKLNETLYINCDELSDVFFSFTWHWVFRNVYKPLCISYFLIVWIYGTRLRNDFNLQDCNNLSTQTNI